jgi:hypothetical protein
VPFVDKKIGQTKDGRELSGIASEGKKKGCEVNRTLYVMVI